LDFCIALRKSGTGVEGSAADDEGRCLGVPGGEMVEETERRLVRAGVRVGSGGAMDPGRDPVRLVRLAAFGKWARKEIRVNG
jgi:hypothetical protein